MTEELDRRRQSVEALDNALAGLRTTASEATGSLAFDLKASTDEIKRMEREAGALSRSLGSGLRSAFDTAIFKGGKLSTVFRDLALSMSRSVLNSALAPVQNAFGSALSGLFSGSFAKGAAFSSGNVRAFAQGGVVSGATAFPMRGGMGVMGEAGPEAIMPLTRGPDGSLGVRTSGKSGGSTVVINIQTEDAQSFRRSQSQVAATITRAVRRGERNM